MTTTSTNLLDRPAVVRFLLVLGALGSGASIYALDWHYQPGNGFLVGGTIGASLVLVFFSWTVARAKSEAKSAADLEANKRVDRANRADALGGQICHLMTEEIRKAAQSRVHYEQWVVDKLKKAKGLFPEPDPGDIPKLYNWENPCLENILGKLVPAYIGLLVGREVEVHCTIKRVALRSVKRCFRSASQKTARDYRDSVQKKDSVPYSRFKDNPGKQCIYIADVVSDSDKCPARYKEEMAKLKVSSILSFPVNGEPKAMKKAMDAKKNLGFYSLDSPEVHVFSELIDVEGNSLRPLDVFFAIADACASILVLETASPLPVEVTK